ncbi:MAG: head GIN domain-containing protein [Chitinophagaceae bacterium]
MKYTWIALALMISGCHINMNSGDDINGNGVIKKETRNLGGFTGVEVAGPFEIMLVQGSSFGVEIEGDENLLQYIDVIKHNGNVEISEKDGYDLHSKRGIKIRVLLMEVNEVSVSGSGSVTSEAPVSSPDKMQLDIAGSGDLNLDVKAPNVSVGIGGSGKATVSGSCRKLHVAIGGSGDCFAEDLLSEECEASIGGSGTARVYASVSLKGSVGGSGDIFYKGKPKNVSKSIGGSGSIEPIN